MITILAYWLLLFAFFLPAGVLSKKLLRITTTNLPVTLLLGMALSTFAFSIAAFFMPLGEIVFLIFISGIAFATYRYFGEIKLLLKMFRTDLASVNRMHRLFLALLIPGAALKSAQLPSIVDNESYYIQTIKWLNEYGFVKGIANLHLFLGQTSGWHVLQAGLNFNFISDRINDLNGFLFVACTAYCLIVPKEREKALWIGLMPAFSAVFFLFIDSPSPDLPILLVLPIIVHLYLKNATVTTNFRAAFTLFMFLAFVKVTIAPMVLLFAFWPGVRKHIVFILAVGIPAFVIWLCKNIILTGYPFYPVLSFGTDVEWMLPRQVPAVIHHMSNIAIYDASDMPLSEKLCRWFIKDGIDGLMNRIAVLLFLIMPLFRKIREDKKYLIIYSCFLVQFIILLFLSPQFRFFLPGMIFFLAFIGMEAFNALKQWWIYNAAMAIGCLAPLVLIFLPLDPMARISRTLASDEGFSVLQLVLPEPRTRLPGMEFKKCFQGRLEYYSPGKDFFIYGTGDGPLPCVNQRMLFMFGARTRYLPEPLEETPGDGYHSIPYVE